MKLANQIQKIQKSVIGQAGFTLVELLIVIAILGILAAGILAAIDPIDKINAANDSKVLRDATAIAQSSQAYAASRYGYFPNNVGDLVTSKDLTAVPRPPGGYIVNYATATTTPLIGVLNATDTAPTACAAGSTDPANPGTCVGIILTAQLKSKANLSKVSATATTAYYRYESANGKTCFVATATTSCP